MSRSRWLTKSERAILEAAAEDGKPPAGRAPAHMNDVRHRFSGAERKIERLIKRGWIERPSMSRYSSEGHVRTTVVGRSVLEADMRPRLLAGTLTMLKSVVVAVLTALVVAAVHSWLGR